MDLALWTTLIGVLLIAMALGGSLLRRLPLSTAMLYLGAGAAMGAGGLDLIGLAPFSDPVLLERAAELAVVVSLFCCGLKLRLPLSDPQWRVSIRLALVAMVATVGLIAALGVLGLGLSIGAAVLLGAILAPTDPVLASDVQVREPGDRDRLRFALTSEAGLNDGTAFPFVMLGLGLLGLHELGAGGWRWWAVDVVWAVGAGLGIGALLGDAVGRTILWLRVRHRTAVGLEEFLTLGLIALAYGLALLAKGYGFLAVFAAGYALQRVALAARPHAAMAASLDAATTDARAAGTTEAGGDASAERAVDPGRAPEHMTREVLSFTEQLERILEVALVLVVGALLWHVEPAAHLLWFVPLLLLVVRPVGVAIGLAGCGLEPRRRRLVSWFGIRGIGSIYYLYYALNHGLTNPEAALLTDLVLVTIAASAIVHGVSVTPLMAAYDRRIAGARRVRSGA